jgi:ADP-ribose pyrophosphatase YjhB (NUDIX family)
MDKKNQGFNIRVYGILKNDKSEVLLSTEERHGFKFTKFPGGGLEWGEGTVDCLQREFMEELGVEINIESHFYTTDYFQRSAFRENDQLISVYYKVSLKRETEIEDGTKALDRESGDTHFFHWNKVDEIDGEDLTFPVDRRVLSMIRES